MTFPLPARLMKHAQEFAEAGREPAPARLASTVVLLRPVEGASDGFEVYAIRRAATMAFAADMYAFPGGAVDPRDFTVELQWAGPPPGEWAARLGLSEATARAVLCAAVREVFEETGIRADVGRLTDWGLENVYDIYPRWQHRYAPGVTRNTEHVFGLRVPRSMEVTLAPHEHTRFEWLPWREAADRCFSSSNAEAILMLPRFV